MSKNNEFFFVKGPTARPIKLEEQLTEGNCMLQLEIMNRTLLSVVCPTEEYSEKHENLWFTSDNPDLLAPLRKDFTKQFFLFIKNFVGYLKPATSLESIRYVLTEKFEEDALIVVEKMQAELNNSEPYSCHSLTYDAELLSTPIFITTDDIENNLVGEKLLLMAYSILYDQKLNLFEMETLILLSKLIDYIGKVSYKKKEHEYTNIDLLEKIVNRHDLFSNDFDAIMIASYEYVRCLTQSQHDAEKLLEAIVEFDGGALVIDKHRKDSYFLLNAITLVKNRLPKNVILKYVGIAFSSEHFLVNDDYETRDRYTIITKDFHKELLEREKENYKLLVKMFENKSKPENNDFLRIW